MINFPIA